MCVGVTLQCGYGGVVSVCMHPYDARSDKHKDNDVDDDNNNINLYMTHPCCAAINKCIQRSCVTHSTVSFLRQPVRFILPTVFGRV